MMHPDTALRFIDAAVGVGVVATRLIPRGTIVWVRDPLDRPLSDAELAALPEALRREALPWMFVAPDGARVLCWDHGRSMNHSCKPSCAGGDGDFELAASDILPGEQLTDDYGRLQVRCDFECLCGEPECRGRIRPDAPDLTRFAGAWRDLFARALADVGAVRQPLSGLLSAADRQTITSAGKPRRQ